MLSLNMTDSTLLPWLVGLVGGALLLYYYTTKTDIPKIKGIPEIPCALPVYSPLLFRTDNRFGHLLELGDVSLLYWECLI
jgi:lipid-A-disaccharide synthase-like uncharacterized protein